MLSFASHRYTFNGGAFSELTVTEEHLLACFDCDEYKECQADLTHCRLLTHEGS